jgi:hypothetical protein
VAKRALAQRSSPTDHMSHPSPNPLHHSTGDHVQQAVRASMEIGEPTDHGPGAVLWSELSFTSHPLTR